MISQPGAGPTVSVRFGTSRTGAVCAGKADPPRPIANNEASSTSGLNTGTDAGT